MFGLDLLDAADHAAAHEVGDDLRLGRRARRGAAVGLGGVVPDEPPQQPQLVVPVAVEVGTDAMEPELGWRFLRHER